VFRVYLNNSFLLNYFNLVKVLTQSRYEDGVDNTAEENSSIFSVIRMRWLPSARACGQ